MMLTKRWLGDNPIFLFVFVLFVNKNKISLMNFRRSFMKLKSVFESWREFQISSWRTSVEGIILAQLFKISCQKLALER